MPKRSELDKIIAANNEDIERVRTAAEARIRELEMVNDALQAVQDAKRKLRKPKPLSAVEMAKGA